MNNFVKIKSMRHDERQSLYVKFDPLFEEIERLFRNSSGEAHEAYSKVLDVISDMAATDKGEPVKRGHWIPSENKTFICSECGYGFEHEGYIHFFNFCPGCGVRIEGVMDKTDTIAEKPFAILNCPECGGEVDMGKMKFCTGKKSASALFECKKCHYYRNIMTEYTNNPQTALMLAWNDYVVSQEIHKAVKRASEEMTRNRGPVDCVKCRFYNGHLEYCRKHSAKTLPFCFCYDGEEREYHIKVTTDNSVLSEAISDMPEYVQQHYAEYWHNKILSDGKEQGNDGQGQAD